MENTDEMLFSDNSPVWYVAEGDRSVGPFSPTEIHQKIKAGELSLADFVWRQGQKDWRRICDTETFKVAAPSAPPSPPPTPKAQEGVKPAIRPVSSRRAGAGGSAPEPKHWFLHYNESQFGPFSKSEVERFLSVGKIHGRVHAWRDGMEGWQRLESISEFSAAVGQSGKARAAAPAKPPAGPPARKAKTVPIVEAEPERKQKSKSESAPESARDQRSAPRRPIVAKIIMTDSDSVIVGVCRDISVGGMQVLTDQVPGVSGTRIKLNVSPSGSGKGSSLTPFVAEGVIVRILEDGRGFSFRFDRLPGDAKRAIEAYIAGD